MATISKTSTKAFSIRSSLQFKYAVCFIAIIAALLIFMNIYPVASFRDAAFEAKHASMMNQAAVVASSLSSLPELREQDVGNVMSMLHNIMVTRLVVTNEKALIIYDTSQYENNVGKYAVFAEVMLALQGKDVFRSKYTGEGLICRASMPVTSEGVVVGTVYIYDFDTEQAGMLETMRGNLLKVSLVILILSLLAVFAFSWLLTKRIKGLLSAMQQLGGGSYDYRVEVRGRDELSGLASEFNTLAERLDRTESMRQRFVSDASHELKTPLAAIKLLTDSILQNEGMDGETMREFMQDIGSEADRLTRTTEKLMNITRLETPDTAGGVTDMKTVVEKAIRMLETLASDKGVKLDVRLGEKCLVRAGADDLHQIVFNLVENAIKYNVERGSVTVLLFKRDKTVRFIVNDTGIGIPDEDLPYIFDRFYRVDKSRESEIGGSGLGLSIVKDVVDRHGGTIKASRREHGGTSFEVVFPAVRERRSEAGE
ncbi:MAG: HAMP domain-containing histidine kinase [Oscillospiraceae bacterium]|nr:HAMP domain-containing histidine kinase [Oscillospiraceae bacterium]